MKIIDKVEINYFRSIYSLTISDCNEINTFVGGNDAGKSNILKALNLFFNRAPDLDSLFSFFHDLSRLRETEARNAKGRATIWIRITFNNFLKWDSLPAKFTVKRTWNRYFDSATDKLSSGVSPTAVGRFLNKITFHYIPAVRGRNIFAHYLSLLHDALIEDEKAGVRESSNALMQKINDSTLDMSAKIREGLQLDSKIRVPEDLRELFSALDFSTAFGTFSIPLQFRGDGLQSRHIPFILDFVARHSSRHHIWAYEEPENSLEMGRAFELAKQFDEDFCKENQIFITTHSPAFYDLAGKHVTKWLVQSEHSERFNEPITTATKFTDLIAADQQMGVAALIANRAREVYEENKKLAETVHGIQEKIRIAERAQVIVEGPSDATILEAAFEKLFVGQQRPYEFVPANGATNAASFISTVAAMLSFSNVPIICVLDNDHAGRKEAQSFFKYKLREGGILRVINQQRKLLFGLLPVPAVFETVDARMRELGGDDLGIPLPIEFMFPPEVVAAAIQAGVLALEDRFAKARDSELSLEINLSQNYKGKLPAEFAYFAQQIRKDSKITFANWVRDRPAGDFENFRVLLDEIGQVCA